ncbi:DEAD/DEAH box helicase domain protein [Shewanella sediminis HAW-EB3]|uniref:DEAD/DEAH box helicase domain protein n=1 Tax=Shewanella sediminis (strain HAW-EB3) TaxID=425104 RepID=A8FYL7_SHESH|nr:DEAD/DEAH box helicase [Shewanella sediminis]ABV37940.1 DEAD/DEAH box helicase domain protein [Shewanella sediminis HAW-EB3]
MKFDALELNPSILEAIDVCGYQQLTQVQSEVIPVALTGVDLMACAETGTGKTAAFALPLIQRLIFDEVNLGSLRGLILTPTRELAIQVAENISRYCQFTALKTLAVYGGANMNPQRKALNAGVDILVATPGRLFDFIGQHGLDLSDVKTLVIDEADRMLDMGFVRDIERVKALVAAEHITHFFSATYSDDVKALAQKMLQSPQWINVAQSRSASSVEQEIYLVDKRRKAELLSELVGRNNWQQVLVFASSKESAEHLQNELKLDGVKSAVFHGDKTQGARNRALEEFKNGMLRVLVATDVAARGLDIQALPLVINLELPFDAEDYIHRIGRTGRAGLKGRAISFVCPSDEKMLEEIETLIELKLPRTVLPGYELGTPLPARYRETQESTKKRVERRKGKPKHGKRGASGDDRADKGKSSYASRRADKKR